MGHPGHNRERGTNRNHLPPHAPRVSPRHHDYRTSVNSSAVQERSTLPSVVVHDFSGHPFQAQLARHLSDVGFQVDHVYCRSFQTPQGKVGLGDSDRFRSVGITLRRQFSKYSALKRTGQELEYGWRLSRLVRSIGPDVVISANTPLLSALVFQLALKVSRTPVVFWQQDVYSVAMRNHLEQKSRRIGGAIGALFERVERFIARSSLHVVAISEDFLDVLDRWGVDRRRISVIENWAPLDEVPAGTRPNPWSQRFGITDDETVLLYAGTLGLKHQPSMLLDLANAFADRADVRVIVASEGLGAEWLLERLGEDPPLQLIPFQPYDELPDMLSSADVLLVLLEPDAGSYSVPSKVLTYHCAARPILGAIPSANLASRTIQDHVTGVVVSPGDSDAFVAAARRLVDEPAQRQEMGRSARRYAEATFDIGMIGQRFVDILRPAIEGDRARIDEPPTGPRPTDGNSP